MPIFIKIMSALKSNLKEMYQEKIIQLNTPWRDILSFENPGCTDLQKLEHQELQVAGIMIGSIQYNFEKISQLYSCPKQKSHLLLALYGLAISCVTGTVHSHLQTYAKTEWYPIFQKMKYKNNYIFMHICKHSLNELAAHFIDKCDSYEWLNERLDHNNDTALHLAIRNRQWEWAKWLIEKGLSPFDLNDQQETPLSLAMPHVDRLDMFCKVKNSELYNALHHALILGRENTSWCCALIEMGADVNQIELYDTPLESLLVFAKYGMDMNLGPLPDNLSIDQLRVFFMYGRQPTTWKHVIRAFPDDKIQMFINIFHQKNKVEDREYIQNIRSRQAITQCTIELKEIYN